MVFVVVGAGAGVLDYLVMVLLREALSVDAVVSALVGYAFGGTASYILNRLKTFRSDRPHREAAWRFAAVNVIGFGLTGLMMSIMVNMVHVNYLISRVFVMIAISSMNFFAYKFWTFSTGDTQRLSKKQVNWPKLY
jgi:putative flippase GtrA